MGSGKKQTIGYWYKWGIQLVFCYSLGPGDIFRRLQMGKKDLMEDEITESTTISVNKPNLFGGEKKEGGVVGDIDILFGDDAQTQSAYLASVTDADIPSFRNKLTALFKQVFVTALTRQVKPVRGLISKYHAAPFNVGNNQIIDTYWINPANMIYAAANSTKIGAGKNIALFNMVNFAATAVTLHAEGYGLSLRWFEGDSEDFIDTVCDHINANFRENRNTGLFEIKLLRNDYDVGALKRFDKNNIVEVSSFRTPSIGETINRVIVKYRDFALDKDHSVTRSNIGNIAAQGATRTQTYNFPGIRTGSLANRKAESILKLVSGQLAAGSIVVNRDGWDLNLGDPFLFSWEFEDYVITDMVVRAFAIDEGDLADDKIMLDILQDQFTMPDTSFMHSPETEWVDPAGAPGEVLHRGMMEATYWDANFELEADQVAELAAEPDLTHYLHYGVRQKGLDNAFHLYQSIDDAGTFNWQKNDDDNGPFAPMFETSGTYDEYLEEEISYDTSVDEDYLVDALPTGAIWETADSDIPEYISIEAIDTVAKTLTIKRGCADTRPWTHADGDKIFVIGAPLSYCAFNHRALVADEFNYVKTRAFNYSDIDTSGIEPGDDEMDAPAAAVENFGGISDDEPGRISRPYPPANVKINTEYFPDAVTGDLAFAWAHRDRTIQTVQLESWTTGNIGPEAGVTYNVVIRGGATLVDADDVLLHTETGLASPVFGYSEAAEYAAHSSVSPFIQVTITSEKDGIESFVFQHSFAREVTLIFRITPDGDLRVTPTGDYRIIGA
jgi:hypothetical protein